MRRDERRQRFHDALLEMLYPPPPPPSQQEDGDKPLDTSPKALDDVDPGPDADDLKENSSSASDGDGECAPQKLTRAQRKRLRRNKLKETASCRRKIIGPQLPPPNGGDLEDKPPKNSHNAADELIGAIGKPGNTPAPRCTNQNKLKQRRMAKRLAREREKSSNTKNCNEDGCPHSADGSLT